MNPKQHYWTITEAQKTPRALARGSSDKGGRFLRKYVCSECGTELDSDSVEECKKCGASFLTKKQQKERQVEEKIKEKKETEEAKEKTEEEKTETEQEIKGTSFIIGMIAGFFIGYFVIGLIGSLMGALAGFTFIRLINKGKKVSRGAKILFLTFFIILLLIVAIGIAALIFVV